jgi:hypothetical protein
VNGQASIIAQANFFTTQGQSSAAARGSNEPQESRSQIVITPKSSHQSNVASEKVGGQSEQLSNLASAFVTDTTTHSFRSSPWSNWWWRDHK